jgi:hypothetical protein
MDQIPFARWTTQEAVLVAAILKYPDLEFDRTVSRATTGHALRHRVLGQMRCSENLWVPVAPSLKQIQELRDMLSAEIPGLKWKRTAYLSLHLDITDPFYWDEFE